jgi:type I restriction enzyme S subunit
VKLLADLGAEAAAPNCVPDLPPSWAWTELGAIAEVVGGVTKDSKRQSDASFVEVPYLRVANVQRGFLDLSSITTIRVAPEKAAQLELQSGDVLFNEGGDRDKLGRGWVWEGQIFRCIHQNVFRARLFGGLESKLVSIWGNTYGREWFENRGKQTTNLASLNLRTLKAFPVPIAPVEEQRRILAEVERQMSFLEACERAVEVGLSRSAGLRRSVLKAASGLLDRIRVERTAHSVAKQRARQKP